MLYKAYFVQYLKNWDTWSHEIFEAFKCFNG